MLGGQGNLLGVILQRDRPGLQKDQSDPIKLDVRRPWDLGSVLGEKSHKFSSLNVFCGQTSSA